MEKMVCELIMHQKLPPFLAGLLFLAFLTFCVALFEPAPFDVMFIGIFFYSFLLGHIKFPRELGQAFFPILILLACSFLSLIFVQDMETAIRFLFITTYLLVFCFYIAALMKTYGMPVIILIMYSLWVGAFITTFLTYMGSYRWWPALFELVTYGASRLKGFFKDPNVFGPMMVMITIYLFYRFSEIKKRFQPLEVLYIGLSLFTILLIYSRAAWAALGLSLVSYYFLLTLNSRSRLNISNFFFIVIGFGVLSITVWFIADMLHYTDLVKQRLTLQDYDNDRFYIHHILIGQSFAHPLGIGPGQTEIMLGNLYNYVEGSGASHNTYIRILIESGYIALFAYIWFLIVTVVIGIRLSILPWKEYGISAFATATLIGNILCGFVIDTLHWRHFWLVCGIIWGLRLLYPEYKKQEQLGMPLS